MGRILLALGALFVFARIAKNRRINSDYARMPASQKALVPRRWL